MKASLKIYIAVLSRTETGSWRQPLRPLREWRRDRMIGRARNEAISLGCTAFVVYGADENRVHSGNIA